MKDSGDPRRHLWLLILLLLIFIVSPFVLPYYYGPLTLNIVAVAVLLSASYAVSNRRLFLIIGLSLSTLTIILTYFLAAGPTHWLIIGAHGSIVVLLGFFAVTILGYVLRRGKVTWDTIYGAVCAYLLSGYAFAFLYSVIQEVQPGSFIALTSTPVHDLVSRFMQMRYFSFVTLASVGYGDIVPHSQMAQTTALHRSDAWPILSCRPDRSPGGLAHRSWRFALALRFSNEHRLTFCCFPRASPGSGVSDLANLESVTFGVILLSP